MSSSKSSRSHAKQKTFLTTAHTCRTCQSFHSVLCCKRWRFFSMSRLKNYFLQLLESLQCTHFTKSTGQFPSTGDKRTYVGEGEGVTKGGNCLFWSPGMNYMLLYLLFSKQLTVWAAVLAMSQAEWACLSRSSHSWFKTDEIHCSL